MIYTFNEAISQTRSFGGNIIGFGHWEKRWHLWDLESEKQLTDNLDTLGYERRKAPFEDNLDVWQPARPAR